jgi:hypothetical protein
MLSAKFDYIARSLQAVTAKLGQIPPDNTVEGASYVGPAENVNKSKGQMCRNCVFFRAPYACTIVRAKIDQEGLCRFNIIPPEKVVVEAQTADKRKLNPILAKAKADPAPAASVEKTDGRK